MLAYKVKNWAKWYELNEHKGPWKEQQVLRRTPIPYCREPTDRAYLVAWRRLERLAGPRIMEAEGCYRAILRLAKVHDEISGAKTPTRRGWLINDDCEVLGHEGLADEIGAEAERVNQLLALLYQAKLLEVAECSFAVEGEDVLSGGLISVKPTKLAESAPDLSAISPQLPLGGLDSRRSRDSSEGKGREYKVSEEKGTDKAQAEEVSVGLDSAPPANMSDVGVSEGRVSEESGVGESGLSDCRAGGSRIQGASRHSTQQSGHQAGMSGQIVARGPWLNILDGVNFAEDDPGIIFTALPELGEHREHAIVERFSEWFCGLFPAEVSAKNKQGRADRTWIFGKSGRPGLFQQVYTKGGQKMILKTIQLAKDAREKSCEEVNPLTSPVGWWIQAVVKLLDKPGKGGLSPEPDGPTPGSARLKAQLTLVDGLRRVFQEQQVELTEADESAFNGVFDEHFERVGITRIFGRIEDLLDAARKSCGKKKPQSYFMKLAELTLNPKP